MTIPAFAPGCFGSALTFKATDMVCQNCPFAAKCEPMHLQSAILLREKMGLKPLKTVAPAPVVAAPVDPLAMSLPKKVQDLLLKLNTGSYDVVGKLSRGENPFGAAIPFMAAACHILLKVSRPVDRDFFSTAFMKKFGWQKPAADEKARIAIYALVHVGAIVSNDGLISLKGKFE